MTTPNMFLGKPLAPQDPIGRHLGDRLHDRTVAVNSLGARDAGGFVLCWLHHAVRDHENPVLDAAVSIGNGLGKPVLVYQGLGGRHRFNSDRHHVFIMEGARDLAAGLARRDISYAFHLPRDPARPGPLGALAEKAAVVVTEDFPAPPFPRWTAALAGRAGCVVVAVDGACVMPMRRLGVRHDRAFRFREAANAHWAEELARPWIDIEPSVEPCALSADTLGFDPVDLEGADLHELAAGCDIDHSVPPVVRVRGGSAAGYARWTVFKADHLRRYDALRNNAADMDAVSCMSPYLHHGHVSAMRIAREARELGGKGAEKFLDELLVWRELSHNFCAHAQDESRLETTAALPEWARQTLAEHEADPRDALYTWDDLAHARTGDALWDAAQRSLLWNGELHNNMRMTWGKMIPRWTRTAGDALRVLIDLNHRFALDGNNPNSYAGLLWCLGALDRPFAPPAPVLGTVRGRDTMAHADRLDPARYASAVRDRSCFEPLRVAVIGGGIAGLSAARALVAQGCEAVVFDRGRTPGGRLATRSTGATGATGAMDGSGFDHGAPCFTVSDARFGRHVRSWIQAAAAAVWKPSFPGAGDSATTGSATGGSDVREPVFQDATSGPLIVGTPCMRAICDHLAATLHVRSSTTVTSITRSGESWRLTIEPYGEQPVDTEPFDAVLLAGAPEQSRRLIAGQHAGFERALDSIGSQAAWILMLELDPQAAAGLAAFTRPEGDATIALLIRDDLKPGRTGGAGRHDDAGCARLVAHSTAVWAAERLGQAPEDIIEELTPLVLRLVVAADGVSATRASVRAAFAHRWSLARPASPRAADVDGRCLFDPGSALAVCGDGLGGSGVEAAFLSAHAAAGRILSLRSQRPTISNPVLFSKMPGS